MFINVWNYFILLLIDDWQLAMQVDIHHSFLPIFYSGILSPYLVSVFSS